MSEFVCLQHLHGCVVVLGGSYVISRGSYSNFEWGTVSLQGPGTVAENPETHPHPNLRISLSLSLFLSLSLSLSADDEPTAAEAPQHPLWVAVDSLIRGGPHAERARTTARQPLLLRLSALRDTRSNWGSPASRLAQPIK